MDEFQVERETLRSEVESLANVFACMIRPLADTSMPVPGSDWTVGEHSAHSVLAQRAFATMVDGGQLDYRGNANELARFAERGGPKLADLLIDSTTEFLKATAQNEELRRMHRGFAPETMTQWTSYSLCHLLMHADPVARTLGFPLPVRTGYLALALPFLQVVMPAILDRSEAAGVCGRLAIQTTDGPSFALSFADGQVVMEPSISTSADCYLKVSSSTFLSVSLGLESESSAIQRNDWHVFGPHPELGRAFKRLFPNP